MTVTEQQHLQNAKGYTPNAAQAVSSKESAEEAESYFRTYGGDEDKRFRREMLYRALPPHLLASVKAEIEGAGPAVDDAPMAAPPPTPAQPIPTQAPGTEATAADKGSGTVPEPTPVKDELPISADPTDNSAMALNRAAVETRTGYDKDVTARKEQDKAESRGKVNMPDPGASPTMNASVETGGGGGGVTLRPDVYNLHSSQSTSARTIEPQEAREAREYADAQEFEAAGEASIAEKLAVQRRFDLANQRVAEIGRMRREDAEFQAKQARVNADAERRIMRAEQALKEVEPDPNFNPVREIMEGDDWGKKILFGLGSMFGSIGATAQTQATGIYHANQFLDQFEKSVNRKLDLMNKRYMARKDQRDAAVDGYTRMRQALQDEAATRAMIEARAWQMFEANADQIMQQYNVDMGDPRARMVLSGIARRKSEALNRFATQVQHVAGQQETLAHSQYIAPAKGSGDDMNERVAKLIALRKDYKIPDLEDGINLVQSALNKSFKDPGVAKQVAILMQAGRFGEIGRYLVPSALVDANALAQLSVAMTKYAHTYTGAAETRAEMLKMAAAVGDGKPEGVAGFLEIINSERSQKQREVYKLDPEAYAVMEERGKSAGQATGYVPNTIAVGSQAGEAEKK